MTTQAGAILTAVPKPNCASARWGFGTVSLVEGAHTLPAVINLQGPRTMAKYLIAIPGADS